MKPKPEWPKRGREVAIKLLAGDFGKGTAAVFDYYGQAHLAIFKAYSSGRTNIALRADVERIEIHTEESVKKLSGTVAWGLAGSALLGPVGLLAGLMLGGKGKQVVFAAYLKDGRKFLAVADSKTFQKIQEGAFYSAAWLSCAKRTNCLLSSRPGVRIASGALT